MTEYHFNAGLARRYGVNGAIFLHAMAFWIRKNKSSGRNFHNGRTWTYNTLEALAAQFPFWSRRQVERIVSKLKQDGALLTGNFNKNRTDRTVWYALADSVLEVYGLTGQNGEVHGTGWGKPYHQTGKCNKETVTDQLNRPTVVPGAGLAAREEVPTW